MKKLLVIASIATAMLTGCTPSAEQINKTAYAIGSAAGLVANQVNVDASARNAVVDILGEVRTCVPEQGQTFEATWTPVIDRVISDMVSQGRITASVGTIIKPVAVIAAQAVDYMFDTRFPEAKKYEELVRAGVSGVIDGFLTVFKPANTKAGVKPEYDEEAYNYFYKKYYN